MKIAVIKTGGKQYVAYPGLELEIEKLEGDGEIVFDEVLLEAEGENINLKPTAKVYAEIVEQTKGKKITAFRYGPKKRWSFSKGHRQPITRVKITKIA
jgi:large subunit ribosomal protein L21